MTALRIDTLSMTIIHDASAVEVWRMTEMGEVGERKGGEVADQGGG